MVERVGVVHLRAFGAIDSATCRFHIAVDARNAVVLARYCTPALILGDACHQDAAHAVVIENASVADDAHVLELRLRNEHAIEWIPMIARKAAGALCVQHRDVQRDKALTADAAEHVGRDVLRAWELAQSRLGRDFPGGGGAHQHRVRVASDQAARFDRQPAITVEPPQEGVRVEQQTHVSLTGQLLLAGADRKKRA